MHRAPGKPHPGPSKPFSTLRDAKAFQHNLEVQKSTGEYVNPALGRITIAELAAGPDGDPASAGWLRRKKADTAPSNYRTLESSWRVHVKTRWGTVQIGDQAKLNVGTVETWIAEMVERGCSPTVVIRAYGVLAGVLDSAVKEKRLRTNPVRGVENLPRKTRKRHIYLTSADVAKLAKESKRHRVLVLVLAYCGLRWGEAIALRVQDIEFLRRRLTVADNAVQLGVDHAVGETKGKAVRSVPVPKFVLDELSVVCSGRARDALVFPHPDAPEKFLPRPKSADGWFTGAVNRAKVQEITPHDLRHTCASLAVSAGVNVLALARMLGHKDPAVTLRVYADLFDSDLDKAAKLMHDAYAA
ncbi:site-specific integrase [Nocardia otitidiscaviarum]|uniref:Site-specific integrase n=1 Tax=Nocardia otitidiscaviarum TaxID=1823 RepID=A0A516NY98_9NOCA|nr:site-specific integrase [Nocardia otitidiscaviarum]MCP9621772.1 site-specific integrase [Nocardia otitidiscaviarum]QDP83885.1 site-specific integrase [Nocardia otitidiscaviarum]